MANSLLGKRKMKILLERSTNVLKYMYLHGRSFLLCSPKACRFVAQNQTINVLQ